MAIKKTIWCDDCGAKFSSDEKAAAHGACLPDLKKGDPIEFCYQLLVATGEFQEFYPKVGPGETRLALVKSDQVLEEPESPLHTGYDYFVPVKNIKKREVAASAT